MIVSMKKAKIVFLKEDEKAVLTAIQKAGELMVIKTEDNHEAFDSVEEDAFVQRSQRSLQTLKPFAAKGKPFGIGEWNEVSYNDFVNPDTEKNGKILAQIEEVDSRISKLKGENDAAKEAVKSLEPWKELDGKLDQLYKTKYVDIHVGYIPTKQVEAFKEATKSLEGEVKLLGVSEENQAVLIVNWHADDQTVMDSIKAFSFIETSLPEEPKTVKEIISEKQSLISNNQKEIEKLEGELTKLAADNQTAIKIFQDEMATKCALNRTPVTTTVETVYLEGWVRADRTKNLQNAIASATKDYDIEFAEPSKEDEVPTVLQNNKFVEPFEAITNMYSRPSVNELDPNPVMSIWYWLIFGLMMGDLGYGVVLAGACFALLKIMKPKGSLLSLIKIFLYGSITTAVAGLLYGSVFGASLFPALFINPQDDPIKMLIFTMVIGIIHLVNGLIMKFIMQVKAGHLLDGLFDQISWAVICVGMGFALSKFCAGMISPEAQASVPDFCVTIGFILLGIGGATVIATAGREKKGFLSKAVGGIVGLYGITSWLSDILSYSRILALAMSGAIIGYVMNMLAGMVRDAIPVIGFIFSIIIYIGGHIFNIAMSLLSAYVHASRLQYIEFFGKFYEGDGKEFKPLQLQYNYVNEIKN